MNFWRCHIQNKKPAKKQTYTRFSSSQLNNRGFLEGLIRATLRDGFQGAGGKDECHVFSRFRYKDFSGLEIGLSAYLAARVELRRTRTV